MSDGVSIEYNGKKLKTIKHFLKRACTRYIYQKKKVNKRRYR